MSIPYNTENSRHFHESLLAFQKVPVIANLDFGYDKISRKQSGLPFSIVKLRTPGLQFGKGKFNFYAVSNMQIGARGGFGLVKVIYSLIISGNKITVDLAQPFALKIIDYAIPYQDDFPIMTRQARKYLTKSEHYPFKEMRRRSYSPKLTKSDRKYYYLMPLFEGMNFQHFLDKYEAFDSSNALSEKLAIDVLHKIAEKVAEFQQKNLVHRDIKPDNIIINITEDDLVSVNIIDLDQLVRHNTKTKHEFGTDEYIDPIFSHQMMHSRNAKATVKKGNDLYAVGILMREIFCRTHFTHEALKNKFSHIFGQLVTRNVHDRISIDRLIIELKNLNSITDIPSISIGATSTPIKTAGDRISFTAKIHNLPRKTAT